MKSWVLSQRGERESPQNRPLEKPCVCATPFCRRGGIENRPAPPIFPCPKDSLGEDTWMQELDATKKLSLRCSKKIKHYHIKGAFVSAEEEETRGLFNASRNRPSCLNRDSQTARRHMELAIGTEWASSSKEKKDISMKTVAFTEGGKDPWGQRRWGHKKKNKFI